MCGCCQTDPIAYKTKYKEKEKGIVKYHPHILIYSNFYWRDYGGDGFICNQCEKVIGNSGCFHCSTCKCTLCPKCFDDLNGEISNEFQVNQKGKIVSHPHILEYKDIISRKIPITARPFYTCKICQAKFPMEYVEAWNCPRCGYDYCEKCFMENGGEVI